MFLFRTDALVMTRRPPSAPARYPNYKRIFLIDADEESDSEEHNRAVVKTNRKHQNTGKRRQG